jgi:hypothetical protein
MVTWANLATSPVARPGHAPPAGEVGPQQAAGPSAKLGVAPRRLSPGAPAHHHRTGLSFRGWLFAQDARASVSSLAEGDDQIRNLFLSGR